VASHRQATTQVPRSCISGVRVQVKDIFRHGCKEEDDNGGGGGGGHSSGTISEELKM
jgi:hypothetical protein